jgi:hypothetical protein
LTETRRRPKAYSTSQLWVSLWSRRFRLRLLVCLLLTLTGVACKGKPSRVTVQNEEPDAGPRLLSTIQMNDPKAAAQLTAGFYAVENNMWRWTAGKFSVQLRTPPAAPNGATLTLSFTVPEVIVQKLKTIRLTASIAGMELKSQAYDTPGPYTFSADVPASLLTGESVTVDFAVDKTMRPDGDKRDLAIIANSIGISAK